MLYYFLISQNTLVILHSASRDIRKIVCHVTRLDLALFADLSTSRSSSITVVRGFSPTLLFEGFE